MTLVIQFSGFFVFSNLNCDQFRYEKLIIKVKNIVVLCFAGQQYFDI